MAILIFIIIGLYGWIEFEALIWIGGQIGGLMSFLGIFITAFIGASLLKSQSAQIMAELQKSMMTGASHIASHLAQGVSILLGGVLMLLPGYVTDLIGLFCFLPGLRMVIGRLILLKISQRGLGSLQGRFYSSGFAQGWGHTAGADEYERKPQTPQNGSGPGRKPISGEIIEGDFEDKSENR